MDFATYNLASSINKATKSSNVLGGIGLGIQGLGTAWDIAGGIINLHYANKANQLARDQYNDAKAQLALENERYNKRENERINANNTFNDIGASAYETYKNKQNAQDSSALGQNTLAQQSPMNRN